VSSLAMIEMGGILIVYVGKSCAWMRFVQKGDEASERDWLLRELRIRDKRTCLPGHRLRLNGSYVGGGNHCEGRKLSGLRTLMGVNVSYCGSSSIGETGKQR
jgi:hypothetical protein